MELVDDVDRPQATVSIGVPNGVRAGLRDGQLEIAERLLVERLKAREAAEREANERDVLGLRGNRQLDGARTAVEAAEELGTIALAFARF